MLTLLLVEAALETVPMKLWNHSAVRRHSKRQKKPPKQLMLDRSLHHSAMRRLNNDRKRGRPDITHFALLEALGSPLNKEGLLQIYVHTNKDFIITVKPTVRLPKNYNRFIGLIEQLFYHGRTPLDGEPLLSIEQKTLKQLLTEIEPDYILGLSKQGKQKTIQEAITPALEKQKPLVMIGGFPHGHFSETTTQLVDEIVCVDLEMMETWTITARIIYEYEKGLSLPIKRVGLY
ncbi:16S rRNA methyltransferase [Candidatus Bathyarchaeota archaeon]|nr:16S rRNA methyltransferase [Candidatus Bathyarchaeota archaeon]